MSKIIYRLSLSETNICMNVSPNLMLFDYMIALEIQFFMNVSAHLMVFDYMIALEIQFFINVLANSLILICKTYFFNEI